MTDYPHKVVLASAGTGKTYALTSQYLKLLFNGENPEEILATTFTRKAAGEIRDRIFERIVEAINNPAEREMLANEIDTPLTEEECKQKLVAFVRHLDLIQISTIDAFFMRLVKLFSHDLGLPAQWGIVSEKNEEEQILEALASMIRSEGVAKVMAILNGLQAAGKRSVYQELQNVVKAMRSIHLESTLEAWDCIEPLPSPKLEEISNAIAALDGFEVPLTQAGTPRKNWETAISNIKSCLPLAITNGNWKDFLALTPVQRSLNLNEEINYSGVEIPESFIQPVKVLGAKAAHDITVQLRKKNIEIRGFLDQLELELSELKHRQSKFAFSDLPLLLTRGIQGVGESADIAYRLDTSIRHLLLDEFQDTNPTQWRVLQPFTSQILTNREIGSYFCVGDVKQSIYGWRQGEPRLLGSMSSLFPDLQEETLSRSYRSSPVILETANRVFSNLALAIDVIAEGDKVWGQGAQEWMENYPSHQSADHLQDLPGAAYLIEARAKNAGETHWDPLLDRLIERIMLLVEDRPDLSIGVLVRSNKPIPSILNRLQAVGIHASGEGGSTIDDSQVVLHFLSLLHFADHPGDSAALYHAQTSPFWSSELLPILDSNDPETNASALRSLLLENGYGKFAASLLTTMTERPEYGDWDRRRFNQLIDIAFSYDQDPTPGRISDFIGHIRNVKVENPSVASVRVMTVHRAKGLEFDAVFMPELQKPLINSRLGILAERPDPEDLYKRVSFAPSKNLREALGGTLEELMESHTSRELQEALCVLYVAMTRAKQHLELIVTAPSKTNTAKTYANLLRHALGNRDPDENGVIWSHPTTHPQWASSFKQRESSTSENTLATGRGPSLAPTIGLRHLQRRSPSDHYSGNSIHVSDLFQSPSELAIRGQVIHRLYEEVDWLESFKWNGDYLYSLIRHFAVTEEKLQQWLYEFRESLELSSVQKLLNQKSQPESIDGKPVAWSSWRERRFCISLASDDGTEILWNGIIDRVNIATTDDGLTTIAASVIDFKTDAFSDEQLVDKVNIYRPQLTTYRQVLSRITALAENEIDAGLLFLDGNRYVPIDSV
ncbi:MAG: UvrD-helicase domain-containing protein [Acidimicrobiales bacterium]|nr:UvrD-helicase domain-containing protein [Acidimicrobiales bacterium]